MTILRELSDYVITRLRDYKHCDAELKLRATYAHSILVVT